MLAYCAQELNIFGALNLCLSLIIAVATICLIWSAWWERRAARKNLQAFADSLPPDEREIFWRLYEAQGSLWYLSRYPEALDDWTS